MSTYHDNTNQCIMKHESLHRLIVICEISAKFCWNFATQDFSQFTQEKQKNVVSLIIIYVDVRQSSLNPLNASVVLI